MSNIKAVCTYEHVCLVSAESYFNDALAIYKLQFGPCHEKTITTQDELARLQIRAEKHEVNKLYMYRVLLVYMYTADNSCDEPHKARILCLWCFVRVLHRTASKRCGRR